VAEHLRRSGLSRCADSADSAQMESVLKGSEVGAAGVMDAADPL